MNTNTLLTENENYQERYILSCDRIRQISGEMERGEITFSSPELCDYFKKVSFFLIQVMDIYTLAASDRLRSLSREELREKNQALYQDVIGVNYQTSYANPTYAAKAFGEDMGKCLCTLYTELRGNIAHAFEKRLFYLTISQELFLQIYTTAADQETIQAGKADLLPLAKNMQDILYYHFFDYLDVTVADRTRALLCPACDFAASIIQNKDLTDLRYLYYFGEFVSENELATAEYLNTLSETEITAMASTFTGGYRKGFEAYRIDLSEKKTVNIRYQLGFERIVKKAIEQFGQMGLKPCIYRAGVSLTQRSIHGKIGYFGASPNRQYDYDHRMDEALIFDKAYADRKLCEQRLAYESMKAEAATYAGPACMETFGENPFTPAECREAVNYDEKQQKIHLDYQSAASLLTNEFIPGDKVSFTIIAYPVPEIGTDYHAIFADTIRVNTLDEKQYQSIQEKLIAALDQGETVTITGRGANRTNLTIALAPLSNPATETRFENCLADVNIPLGEVFTTPQLSGTNGTLHVTSVYLNELHYKDFELTVKDGRIVGYSCANFDSQTENRTFIEQNFLFHHETLPMGEFAIGTNTTAYAMCVKYGISHLLPILIAEKTGPHFAFGDTCFSHEEDLKTYNPDGKLMTAKENDYSKRRDSDSRHAYFNCHTDVTIPYHELGDIIVNLPDGGQIPLLREGRFVLAGTEELNKPLDAK